MRTNVSHTTHKIAAAAVLTMALAGCGQVAGSGTPPPTSPTATSTTSQAPSTTTTTTTSGAQEPTSSGAATKPPAPGLCTSGDLDLSLGTGGAAAGTYYAPLRFTNASDSQCVVHGFPGVSYVAGDDGHQVGPAAYREGTKGAPVTLKPGDVAHATVGFVQVRNYDPAVCKPTPVRGLRVYPPQETESMFLPVSGREGCAGHDIPGNQLTVKTIQPGPGGR